MDLVMVFAAVLFASVLVSDLAQRTVLSTAVLFLAAGFLFGEPLGILHLDTQDERVRILAELALFAVLFTDGMRAGVKDIASAWHLPGRALFIGLPLTFLGTALAARLAVGLDWQQALLVGAALSPTDPVFAAAIVGRDDVPWRLRHLLNIESGLNDGLALPFVVVLLHLAQAKPAGVDSLLGEVGLGILLGIVMVGGAVALQRLAIFTASRLYEPLNAFAIGLLLLAAATLTHANEFLAAFTGGVMVATIAPPIRDAFRQFGEVVAELLKLAALLTFGALMAPSLFHLTLGGYVFVVLALLLVRPVALGIALIGGGLEWREWVTAAWFGPKGFASVVYGLLIVLSNAPYAYSMFQLIAVVVTFSIVLHSSTDVLFARWFRMSESAATEHHAEAADLKAITGEGSDRIVEP